jgi:hypothetical protein
VFPNPASDYFEIESESPVSSCVVYDISGKEISVAMDLMSGIVDISGLEQGLYIIKFMTRDAKAPETVKLLKE